MKSEKLKHIGSIFIVVIAVIFTLVFSESLCANRIINESQNNVSFAESDENNINLFNEDSGKFNLKILNSMAKSLGYKDVDEMNDAVKGGDIKTATAFGSSTLKLGSFTNKQGAKSELSWYPVYLSKDGQNNAVLTLYLVATEGDNLSSDQEISTWSDGTYHSTAMKDYGSNKVYSNTYDSSYIRHAMLNGDDGYLRAWGLYWQESTNTDIETSDTRVTMPSNLNKFTLFTSGALAEYTVSPSNMSWQMAESLFGNDPSYANSANYPQEWVGDKVWLPSLTEISSGGLWELSGSQRQNSVNTWTRSASAVNGRHCAASFQDGTPSEPYFGTIMPFAVRPAVHINVSAAIKNAYLELDDPTDMEVIYSGEKQTLGSLSKKPKWYQAEYYANADNIVITYPDGGVKDAGEYWVKVELNEDWVSAQKAKGRNLKFAGSPNTSDSEHLETDTVRFFKMTVAKKKIAVKIDLDSNGIPQVDVLDPAEIYIGDTLQNNRAPSIGFTYTSTDGKGYTFDNVIPNKVGEYLATAKLLNRCNYDIDTSKPYTITFMKGKTKIVSPTVLIKSKQYNQTEHEFPLLNGSINDIIVQPMTDALKYDSEKSVLKAKDAGKYKVRIALKDKNETEWRDETDKSGDIFIEVEITKKPLGITFGSESGWSWSADKTPTVTITGDSYAGDQTVLYIYYCKGSDTRKYDNINDNKQLSADGKTRTIVMPKLDPETYYIGVEIYSVTGQDNKSNGNYYLVGDVAKQVFTVTGANASFKSPEWLCNDVKIENSSAANPLAHKVTYNGKPFGFAINEALLEGQGVEIDKSKGTNGYEGKTSAEDAGNYSVKVHLKALEGYNALTVTEYVLNYEIEKAKYDLRGLKWSYDTNNPIRFSPGKTQEVKLTGNIPQGLTVNYINNRKMNVNTESEPNYVASVRFEQGASYGKNYVLPSAQNANSYIDNADDPFSWTCVWEIDKARLVGEWTYSAGANIVTVPKLKPDVASGISVHEKVKYTFWQSDGAGNKIGAAITEKDITYDKEHEKYYIAEASLLPEYEDSYEIMFTETSYQFVVGVDRYPVTLYVEIDGAALKTSYPYKGSAYSPIIKFINNPGNINISDIVLTFYKANSDGTYDIDSDGNLVGGTTIPPVVIGKYKAIVSVKIGVDSFVESNCDTFEFEIVKADFDVSELKWKYTHKDIIAFYDNEQKKWLDGNGNELLSFTYDGFEHKIELSGKDDVDGLGVRVEGDLSVIDAKEQCVVNVLFDYDKQNYNAPSFEDTFNWKIGKASVDMSGIKWGYKIGDGEESAYTDKLPYTRVGDSSSVAEYTVLLVDLPDALKECIEYINNSQYVSSASKVGKYTARFEIDGAKFNSNNYEECRLPAGLSNEFVWEITPRVIDAPSYDNTFSVFDGKVHNVIEMCGMEDDWRLYYDVSITKDYMPYNGLTGDDFSEEENKEYKMYDAGIYRLHFTLKNPGTNVVWSSWAKDIVIDAKTYSFEITGWNDNGMYSTCIPSFDDLPNFFGYRYKDIYGNIIDDIETIYSSPNTAFFREVYVKEPFKSAGNVALGLKNTEFRFVTDAESGTMLTPIPKPTLSVESIPYDGKPHSLTDLIEGFDPTIMEFVEQPGKAVDTGEYKVMIRFKNGQPCRWDTTDGSIDRDRVILTFTIEKNFINVPSVPDELTYIGKEIDIASILEGFDPNIMTIAGQVYVLNAGTYKVTVSLKNSVNYGWAEINTLPLADGGEEEPNTDIEIDVDVHKVKLPPKWELTDGRPSFVIPSQYRDLVEINVLYYSKDGNEISADSLEKGNSYNAVAKLADGYDINFEFVDSKGVTIDPPTESAPYSFDIKDGSNTSSGVGNGDGTLGVGGGYFPLWLVVLITIMVGVVCLDGVFMPFVIMFKKSGSKKEDKNSDKIEKLEKEIDEMRKERLDDQRKRSDELSNTEKSSDNETPLYRKKPLYASDTVFYSDEKAQNRDKLSVDDASGDIDTSEIASAETENMGKGEFIFFRNEEGKTIRQVDNNALIIDGIGEPRPDFDMAYAELTEEQRAFMDGLYDYAIEKSGKKGKKSKFNMSVGFGANQVIKLGIKDGMVFALFKLEDMRLKQLRRNSENSDIKTKETVIQVADKRAFETAKEIINLRIMQIDEEKEYRRKLRREKRKAQRDAKDITASGEKAAEESNAAKGVEEDKIEYADSYNDRGV